MDQGGVVGLSLIRRRQRRRLPSRQQENKKTKKKGSCLILEVEALLRRHLFKVFLLIRRINKTTTGGKTCCQKTTVFPVIFVSKNLNKKEKRQNGRHCCGTSKSHRTRLQTEKKKNWKFEPSPSPVSAISTIVSHAIEKEMKESIQMSAACEDRSAGGKWKPPKLAVHCLCDCNHWKYN